MDAYNLLLKLYETHMYYIENRLYEEVRVPYLSGPPGTGKTSMTKTIAATLNLPYNRIDISMFEYYEIKGLLYPDEQMQTAKIIELDVIPTDKCVLCVDEINSADYSLQKVLAGLIYERQIVKRRLHDETFVICCGNPSDTVSNMYDLLEHLQDRLIELPIQPTFDELMVRVAKLSVTAYNVYRMNYTLLKRYYQQHKSMRPLTAAVYPIEQYVQTNDQYWFELIRRLIPIADDMVFQLNEEKSNYCINNVHDLLSIILNIDQWTKEEIEKLDIDNNLLFTAQNYCKAFGLLDNWKAFLLKLDEERRKQLAEWLVGIR